MIKFFRKIRQKLLSENKFSKYLIYAAGEIILVVIGILIALQLNTAKENKERRDLGYNYLTEMRMEVQNDFFSLDKRIRMLNTNIKNHEAALRTHNLDALPLDSIMMIFNPENLDFKISELTFNKMKNLGLTSISDNDDLNTQISFYYNSSVEGLKLGMDFVFQELKKYLDFFQYDQDAIDFILDPTSEYEFPALYDKSKNEFNNETRQNSIQFIKSTRGRMIILNDLDNKRYSLRLLKSFKTQTQDLLESIVEELKSNNEKTEPLPDFPLDSDFEAITVSPEILANYIGAYQTETDSAINVFLEDTHLYIQHDDGEKNEIVPSGVDAFFIKSYYVPIKFNKNKNTVISLTINSDGNKREYLKIDP